MQQGPRLGAAPDREGTNACGRTCLQNLCQRQLRAGVPQESTPLAQVAEIIAAAGPAGTGLLASAAASHGGQGGELLAIYHGEVNEDSDGPVEVCAPVARPDAVPSGMAIRAEAAHRQAYATITRAQFEYPQILSAYDAVADWISSAGLARAGPPREVYLQGVDVAAAAPGEPVCHIAYPIRS
jgi:hypothetical protein